MSTGPLRRAFGTIGLIALVPIAFMLATGALTAEEAALRAVAVAIAVMAVGNVVRMVLTRLLHRVERRAEDRAGPQERRGDQVSASTA